MPDILNVFSKWWKMILGISLLATVVAFIVASVSPKEYLSTATALPVNSMVADKARIFNNNIEALYSDFGTPDELDRMEGTGVLDTLFIATAKEFNLDQHYGYGSSGESWYKAAVRLKKNSKIARSAYGELKVKVWDEDRNLAASVANSLMQGLQNLHMHLQNQNNSTVLAKLKEDYSVRQQDYLQVNDSISRGGRQAELLMARKVVLFEQLQQYEKMMDQYQLALRTNPQVLLTVEAARPSLWPDKPKIPQVIVLTFAASLVLTFLVALMMESRKAQDARRI
jgi:hypothetical protein